MSYPEHNTQLSVTGPEFDLTMRKPSQMHYKAAAAACARILRNNARYSMSGKIRFPNVQIWDNGFMVGEVSDSSDNWTEGIESVPNVFAAVRYIHAAARNTRQQIQTESNEWLTPTEIADEFKVQQEAVRQRINRNRGQWLEMGAIKEADGRTVLMRRGAAISLWQQRRRKHIEDTVEFYRLVDVESDHPTLWMDNYPLRPELYDILKDIKFSTVKMIEGVPYIRIDNWEGTLVYAIKALDEANVGSDR